MGHLMTYILTATLTLAVLIFARWRGRPAHTPAPAYGPLVKVPAAPDMTGNPFVAEVAAGVGLALKRLTPLISSRSIRVDVAVRPGLLVRMSGDALAELLEELLGAAIHHADAGRMVVTAASHGAQVNISVTDSTPGADASTRAADVRTLAEKAALRGAALEIDVRRSQGTTMTLRLATALEHSSAADIVADIDAPADLIAPHVSAVGPRSSRHVSRLGAT